MGSDDGPTIGELRRRLERAEVEIKEIRRDYPSQRALDDRLALVASDLSGAQRDIARVEEAVESVDKEATQRRLLTYAAVLTAFGSLVVSLILGGALTVGGG